MNIGLVDVDGKRFPNYALIKISAYHKKQGDNVEWANHLFPYDIVYKSKIFTFSQEATLATTLIRSSKAEQGIQ